MKQKICVYLTLISMIGFIGTIGGLEHNMFGFGSCLIRLFIFATLTVVFGVNTEKKKG